MAEAKTAGYKILAEAEGNRYLFFCDVSGAHVYTTKKVYSAALPEEELMLAWQAEGSKVFNQCHKCGKWVVDALYNVEVLECVECTPYACEPNYCKSCGKKIDHHHGNCPFCGKPLVY